MIRSGLRLLVIIPQVMLCASLGARAAQVRFTDDFEAGLSGWRLVGGHAIGIVDSGAEEHGRVMELKPDGAVYALIEGSDQWGKVRLEADFLFPEQEDSNLELIYDFTASGTRTDFGCVYVSGLGSYLRVNPWRDGNASRLLYEEYRTRLLAGHAIEIGRWHHIMAEVDGHQSHVYVDDMQTPKLTFDMYEGDSGLVGFKPRVVGGPVRIDNVRVASIERLAYAGPPIPSIAYETSDLLTEWEAIGPFRRPIPEIERNSEASEYRIDGERHAWRPFTTDRRGAVITAKLTEYSGERPVAYFRTRVRANAAKEVDLVYTSTDELGLFLNDWFQGFLYRDGYVSGENDWNAWHDFLRNPEHAGDTVPLKLEQGANTLVIRVRNGQFASGGFFAAVRPK